MKKELMNKQIVRAISLGLSAVMLTTPMTAMASDGTDVLPEDDDNKVEQTEKKESSVCDTAQEASQAADAAVDEASSDVVTVKADVVVNVEPGEAGTDGDGNDLSQAVIDAAANVENPVSENGTPIADTDTDIQNVDTQLEKAEASDALAKVEVGKAEAAVEDAAETAGEAEKLVEEAYEKTDAKLDDIKNAGTIADANAAYDEMEAAVTKAKADLDAKVEEYNTAKDNYDKAVAKVAEYEKAYNEAIATAGANAEDAAKELEEAKANAEVLKNAVDEAKNAVDDSAAAAMEIAAAEEKTETDNGLNWKNQDELFKTIMKNYYIPEVLGVEDADVSVERIQGKDNNDYNYFVVTYADGSKEYYNYKMEDKNTHTSKLVIFEKREVEIFGDPNETPDRYVVDGTEKVVDVEKGLNDGTVVKTDDGKYVLKNADGTETPVVLKTGSEITNTSTEDVIVSDETETTYSLDENGNLVETVTADVTTITYTGASFTSEENYASDEARDAAAALKEAELEAANDGKDAVVTETQETSYVVSGTYIPAFSKTINVDESCWNSSKNGAVSEIAGDIRDDYEDDNYYVFEVTTNNLTAKKTANMPVGSDKYKVSGTSTVTYAKIEKGEVDLTTWDAFWSDLGFSGKKEASEENVRKFVSSMGGILVNYKSWNWDWNTATYEYVKGVTVTSDACDSKEAATADFNAKVAGQADDVKNGVAKNIAVKDTKTNTTYSYKIDYLEKGTENTVNETISTTVYADADVLKGEIIQNLNWINDNILLDQDDNDYREFVDDAKEITSKYNRLLEEAKEAEQSVTDAEKKVAELQKAIDELKGKADNSDELDKLSKELADAEAKLADAQEDYKDLEDKLGDAAEELDKVIENLTPNPINTDDNEEDADAEDEEDSNVTSQGGANPAALGTAVETVVNPAAVQPVIGTQNVNVNANANAGQAIVNIDDEATPLAGGIDETEDIIIAQQEDTEDTIVTIEDEATPLAPTPEEKAKMSWWWLLIVALLGATGYKMYKDHQKKKEEAQEA